MKTEIIHKQQILPIPRYQYDTYSFSNLLCSVLYSEKVNVFKDEKLCFCDAISFFIGEYMNRNLREILNSGILKIIFVSLQRMRGWILKRYITEVHKKV